MTIEQITIDLIDSMDADQMRSTLKSIRTDYDLKVAEDAEAKRVEEERTAKGRAIVNEFFARKKQRK